jgi:hypothetical protein
MVSRLISAQGSGVYCTPGLTGAEAAGDTGAAWLAPDVPSFEPQAPATASVTARPQTHASVLGQQRPTTVNGTLTSVDRIAEG